MRIPWRIMTRVRHRNRDPWLVLVLVVSVGLGMYHLSWGLPNGNRSWAADSLGPLTVLSIAQHSLTAWNSGWFYFKYPLGYPLLLLTAYAPYLAVLRLTGGFGHPTTVYPYGFSNPAVALHGLALLGRGISVACVVATAALTYGIGRRLFGRTTGALAAWLVATAYPLVYYAHTTNLDAAYLFWLVLALWATVVAAETGQRWSYMLLGIAGAMAVSTKEQGFAFLLPLPLILLTDRRRALVSAGSAWQRWWAVLWNRDTRAALMAAGLTGVLANNVLLNPSGFVNRIVYLSGRPVAGVSARLAPVEFALFKGGAKEWQYVRQLVDGIESSVGLPVFVLVVAGVCYVIWRRRRAAAYLLLPALALYYLSLRALDLITLRYTLPLSVVGALCGAALCAHALEWKRRWLPSVLIVAICLLGVARAIELDWLLRHDTRYRAEAWLRQHVPLDGTVETYQKPVYLPRFAGLTVGTVPLAQRTIGGIQRRQPDFIVISSAAKQAITHRWNPDWRQGHTLLVEQPQASAFLDALEDERLPYRPVARFSQRPVLLRLRITSLCPQITIFQRVQS
ncbi:MAG: ArnT family glycosyltransferase [Candidatus Binatia bacterium]